MKQLKICIVSHSYPTRLTSAQAVFIKNEAHLIADHQDVEVYLPSVYALPFQKQFSRTRHPDEEKLPVHHFSYLSFPKRMFPSITQKSLSKNLLTSIEPQNPDIVHLHWLYPAGLAAPSVKEEGYPLVLTIHGGDWYSNVSNQHLMSLLEESLKACDKIICVGRQLAEDMSNYNSFLHSKLVHIPHGIDTNIFYPTSDQKNILLKLLGWSIEKTNILCVANLYHGKGIDVLIEAFTAIQDKKRCHLHIISPGGDSSTKSKVDNLINDYSLQNQVTLYGHQEQEQLANFYRAADLLVCPSRREGFGLVVAEAIACGTPVLATRSGGPEEIVNSECGILVRPESVDELNTGLEKLLKNLNRYEEVTMHQHIKTHFSISAKKKKLMSVYREITN